MWLGFSPAVLPSSRVAMDHPPMSAFEESVPRSDRMKTPSAKSRGFPAGKGQTAAEAVLNIQSILARNAAGRKNGLAAGGFMRASPDKPS